MSAFLLALGLAQDAQAQALGDDKAVIEVSRPDAPVGNGERWALIIGVNQYRDGTITDLRFAVSDAKALASQLQTTGGYDADHVILMHSAQENPSLRPTRANILVQLDRLTKNVQGADQVLFYFSGHGLGGELPDGTRHNYLLTSDARMEVPEATALVLEDVVRWIGAVDAQQRVIILDACRNERDSGAKGLTPSATLLAATTASAMGTRLLYSNSFGSVSYEQSELKMGAFTWWLVEGLKCGADGALNGERDGLVTIDELYRFTTDQLAEHAIPGREQRPTQGGEWTGDFAMAAVPLGCIDRPPRPKYWSYPDLRAAPRVGVISASALTLTVPTYLAWRAVEGDSAALRGLNYGFGVAGLGLLGAGIVLQTRGLLEYQADTKRWDSRYATTGSAPSVSLSVTTTPGQEGVQLGVQGRF